MMIRKMLTAVLAAVALLFSVLALNAEAGPTCPYSLVISDDAACADAAAYPGPFTNVPDGPSAPYGWGAVNAAPAAGAADAGGTGGGDATGLVQTGSESTVLAYVGTGLVAFGAVAVGSRRKFFQGALD